MFDIYLLAAGCHGADNFTDLLPMRKFPIRRRWDVVDELIAHGLINGTPCERVLLFLPGDELHRVL